MDLIVSLDHILDVVTLNSIDADGIKSLATLRAINAMNLSELGNHVKGSDVLGEKLKGVDLSVPVNSIHLVAEKVRHLRIDIDWSKVFVIDNLEFKRNFKLHPSTMQNIASAVSSQLKKKKATHFSRHGSSRKRHSIVLGLRSSPISSSIHTQGHTLAPSVN